MKVLRWSIALALSWALFEGWARVRYDLNNPWLPMGLRNNIASTSLEAHRLKPNRHLMAKHGISFHTDQFGFRCEETPKELPAADKIILGGDSIAFGMFLNFKDSLGHHLQKALKPNFKILVSALPSGSQAMTQDLLFGPDQLAKKSEARWILHSINHYDETDNLRYQNDKLNQQGWRQHVRKIKTLVGPYGIQMLQLKLQNFLAKDKRKDLLLHADNQQGRGAVHPWPNTQRALENLKKSCDHANTRLALFFLPQQGELEATGHRHNDAMETWATSQGIPFIDIEQHLEGAPSTVRKLLFKDDGIHLTAKGSEAVASLLADFAMGLER
jgi:hypothetical protein